MRIGCGFDVHAFGPGNHVTLAGVKIPHSRGLVAHSDGDVVLHALCDALLGAAGLGDIGMHFRNDDPRWAGADSRQFVVAVLAMLKAQDWSVVNVDITLLAEVPKIMPYRQALHDSLSSLLPGAAVNLKATTTEGLGSIGRAEGIAAYAVALLE
jgi:2-C-methyl-D-erythritol 2,4-cyclodiphosphate synthase